MELFGKLEERKVSEEKLQATLAWTQQQQLPYGVSVVPSSLWPFFNGDNFQLPVFFPENTSVVKNVITLPNRKRTADEAADMSMTKKHIKPNTPSNIDTDIQNEVTEQFIASVLIAGTGTAEIDDSDNSRTPKAINRGK